MSKKRKQRTEAQINHDLILLNQAGYYVRIFSPYHWHVSKPPSWVVINVWPTAGKYMQEGAHGANRYVDILKAVDGLFRHNEGTPKAEVQKAKQQVEDMRERGLEYFTSKNMSKSNEQ